MPNQKVAIVTGSNKGIGFETCRQLASLGLNVVLTSRDEAKGQAAQKKLGDEGTTVLFHRLDVTDQASVTDLAVWVAKELGRLDVLINNAGISLGYKETLFDIGPKDFEQVVQTNLIGAYNTSRALIPLMQENQYGRVVMVSSGYGAMAAMTARNGSYKISKLALNGLCRILASEVNPREIKINTMAPGWVRTDMGGPMAQRSPAQGAETIIHLATLPDDGPTGFFFQDKKTISW